MAESTPPTPAAAVKNGLAQFGIGTVTGLLIDLAFPARKTGAPLAEGLEVAAQIAVNAIVVQQLQYLVIDRLDPSQNTAVLFYVGLLASQPNLLGKIQKFVGASKLAVLSTIEARVDGLSKLMSGE